MFNTSTRTGAEIDGCTANIDSRVDTETGEILPGEYKDQFDHLMVTVEIKDANGAVIETREYSYETWYNFENPNLYSENEVYDEEVEMWFQLQKDSIRFWNPTTGEGIVVPGDSLSSINFRITANDGGMWDGTNGPIVQMGDVSYTYRSNPCANTALFDPSCPGYAEAYAEQEYDDGCTTNPMYDSGCSGYESAYHNQQCSADPLYDQTCPGYENAYLHVQFANSCSDDQTYDFSCPGYADAYHTQQCEASAQYSSDCEGYIDYATYKVSDPAMNVSAQGSDYIFIYRGNNPTEFDILVANLKNITNWVWGCTLSNGDECPGEKTGGIKGYDYQERDGYLFLYTVDIDDNVVYPDSGRWYKFAEYDYWEAQCTENVTWDDTCPGYAGAVQQQEYDTACSASALYDSGCPGYATAYLNYQCNANPLYDSSCTGYATAYFNYQCSTSALYDTQCPGYATAYFNYQCDASALYDPQCTGHKEAQCEANALYDFTCRGYDTAYLTQQCMYNPQYDTSCNGYIEPITETPTQSTQITEGTSTGDAIVDSVIAVPIYVQPIQPQEFIIMPQPPTDIPTPVEIEVSQVDIQVEIASIDVQIAQIESDIEIEIAELEAAADVLIIEDTFITNVTDDESLESEIIIEDINVEEDVIVEEETTEEEITEETTEETTEEETTEETIEEETTEEIVIKKTSGLTVNQKASAKKKKIKELIVARLEKLAQQLGDASTLAAQKDLQNYVLALIGFNPDFATYNTTMPGNYYYDDRDLNNDKEVPENQRGLLNGLANEILHNKMVDEQDKDIE